MRTDRVRLALPLALLVLAVPMGATAGVGDLTRQIQATAIESKDGVPAERAPAGDAPAATADAKGQATLLEKCNEGKPVTPAEFRAYLDLLEAANPGLNWQTLVSKLHKQHYSGDRELTILGIDLFAKGDENKDFDAKVKLPAQPPKFMIDSKGRTVDLAHAYAGIAANVNRNPVTGDFMTAVNTHWGDALQVAGGWITGAKDVAVGAVKTVTGASLVGRWLWPDLADKGQAQVKDGAKDFSNAHKFMPPDQVRGNSLGIYAKNYLVIKPKARLSDAFDVALRSYDVLAYTKTVF